MKLLRKWKHRRLLKALNEGKMSINDARRKLGLPPWEDAAFDKALGSAEPKPW